MTRPLAHWLLLFALVAMWGSAFMMTGIAVRGFTPATLVAIRLVIAAGLLGGLVLLSGRRFPASRRFWLFGLAISLAGNCVPFWLISFGQQRIDSSLAGILMGLMPLTTMVLAHFFVRGERLNLIKAAGFMLGFAGLVVLIGPTALLQLQGEGGDLWYQLAVLAGAVCYAINAILARHRPPADPLVAAAGVMIVGSLVMLPIGGPAAPAELASVPTAPLVAMLALAVIAHRDRDRRVPEARDRRRAELHLVHQLPDPGLGADDGRGVPRRAARAAGDPGARADPLRHRLERARQPAHDPDRGSPERLTA